MHEKPNRFAILLSKQTQGFHKTVIAVAAWDVPLIKLDAIYFHNITTIKILLLRNKYNNKYQNCNVFQIIFTVQMKDREI